MSSSPIEPLLEAIDGLDAEAVMALLGADCRLLTADGRRGEGTAAVRDLLVAFLAGLRSSSHTITAQWQADGVWIAEVDARYELRDWLRIGPLPRAFVVRGGAGGIDDLRVYGAHEHPLTEHRTGEEGMVIGTRWIPPL